MPEYKSYQLVGGKPVIIDPLTVSEEGTVFAPEGHAFNPVVCTVGGVTPADNGKVVVDGELVEQTAMPDEITEDGEYDTTIYNSVTVSFGGGGGAYDRQEIVTEEATLSDVLIGYINASEGVMDFTVNIGGTLLPASFAFTVVTDEEIKFFYGGAYDTASNQGFLAQFHFEPEMSGLTCDKLIMVNGTTLTDLTTTAASIISDITITVYEPTE